MPENNPLLILTRSVSRGMRSNRAGNFSAAAGVTATLRSALAQANLPGRGSGLAASSASWSNKGPSTASHPSRVQPSFNAWRYNLTAGFEELAISRKAALERGSGSTILVRTKDLQGVRGNDSFPADRALDSELGFACFRLHGSLRRA